MSRLQLTKPAGSVWGTAYNNSGLTEHVNGNYHTTSITVNTNFAAIAGAGAFATGVLVYSFPTTTNKYIFIDSVRLRARINQTSGNINADTPDLGIGTQVASGANALLSASSNFENIVTGQTAPNCINNYISAVTTSGGYSTNDSLALYLNVADTWSGADSGPAIQASIVINWHYAPLPLT